MHTVTCAEREMCSYKCVRCVCMCLCPCNLFPCLCVYVCVCVCVCVCAAMFTTVFCSHGAGGEFASVLSASRLTVLSLSLSPSLAARAGVRRHSSVLSRLSVARVQAHCIDFTSYRSFSYSSLHLSTSVTWQSGPRSCLLFFLLSLCIVIVTRGEFNCSNWRRIRRRVKETRRKDRTLSYVTFAHTHTHTLICLCLKSLVERRWIHLLSSYHVYASPRQEQSCLWK